MSEMIEEAIEDYCGPRCEEHYPGCAVCDTWAEYDALVAKAKECDRLALVLADARVSVRELMDLVSKLGATNATHTTTAANNNAAAYTKPNNS